MLMTSLKLVQRTALRAFEVPESWILTEGHAAMETQALGLTEALGIDAKTRRLTARFPWDWLPGALWPLALRGVTVAEGPLAPPWPHLAVTCGNVAAPVGAALRKRGVTTVHVQDPKLDPACFDVVVTACHDRLVGPNVVTARNALHRVTPQRLADAREIWAPRLAHLPRPLVAVLVGGSNGRFRLDGDVADAMAGQLAAMMQIDGVGLAVTTSRRTGQEATQALTRRLAPLGAFVWSGGDDNPYFGLLAVADTIIVTCDSISMLSEAAATSVPMFILRLPGRGRRNQTFLTMLLNEGRARMFEGRVESWDVIPLDDTAAVAAEVRRRIGI
jgi:mitochondrial fission protein ELM1